MIRLTEIVSQIIQELKDKQLNEWDSISLYESKYFEETADPNFAYEYYEPKPNTWEFNDKYGNSIGCRFIPGANYYESYFNVKTLDKKDIEVFTIDKSKLDPNSFSGGTDEHRSDTICKILRDEVLNRKPSFLKIHPIDEYRHKIFKKCAEICKEKYSELEIKEIGKEIYLINK